MQKKALILIDIQPDFLPGGALAVPAGDEILSRVEQLAAQFDTIVLSQDWHPAGHKSFASSHGAAPFTTTQMPYGEQVLWPDHCIQGTPGAGLALPQHVLDKAALIIRKGMNPEIDSYSAFMENDQKTSTGLAGWLRDRGIQDLTFAGLALDYCVAFSALDARKSGFGATVDLAACRGISHESIPRQIVSMRDAGVSLTWSDETRKPG